MLGLLDSNQYRRAARRSIRWDYGSGSSTPSDGFNSIPSATGGIARLACARLDEMGKDPTVLLSKVGLTPEAARDPAVRLEVRTQIKLLDLAAEEVQDEWLGFEIGRASCRERVLYTV